MNEETKEMDDFSQRFRQLRKELGKTQSELGKDLSFSHRTIQRLEDSSREHKFVSRLKKIHSLGYDLNWLITGEKQKN